MTPSLTSRFTARYINAVLIRGRPGHQPGHRGHGGYQPRQLRSSTGSEVANLVPTVTKVHQPRHHWHSVYQPRHHGHRAYQPRHRLHKGINNLASMQRWSTLSPPIRRWSASKSNFRFKFAEVPAVREYRSAIRATECSIGPYQIPFILVTPKNRGGFFCSESLSRMSNFTL